MKKLISLFLALVLCLPFGAAAEDISGEGAGMLCGDSLSWYVDGSVLYISGQGEMYDFPGGAPWQGYKSYLTGVVLSGGVTTVGAYAFQDYNSLYSVDFGSSLVRIGADAFSSCDALASITLPATFKKFGENSFRSCPNLKEIHCSGNFPRFDENCLWDTQCTIYYSVNNPWSVIYIEQLENAFHGRIEFRASDGTDPYVPTVPTQPTEVTQPPVYIPETTQVIVYTEPVIYTQPTTVPTQPVQTQPATQPTTQPETRPEPTEETFLLFTQPTRAQENRPEYQGSGTTIYGVLIIVITLSIIGTCALLFRASQRPKKRRRRKKRKRRS